MHLTPVGGVGASRRLPSPLIPPSPTPAAPPFFIFLLSKFSLRFMHCAGRRLGCPAHALLSPPPPLPRLCSPAAVATPPRRLTGRIEA
eukprot:SAG22_NODE_10385_length_538_cov_0.968109_1_plen_87_part_10